MKLTGMSLPQMAEKIKGAGKDVNSKTLWNWVHSRYKFRVMIECEDSNPEEIIGIVKETKIV